jgi:uncharacterized protein YdhG (YjbR/CyaY superfamily)
METIKATNIDEYIAGFPVFTRELLETLRATIKKAAPEAEEVISYGMPAFKFHGILVYFAGYTKHIGFYPTGSGIAAFKKELKGYVQGKGSVQFPLDEPLPLALITKIVKLRVAENLGKAALKTKKK